MQSRWLILDEIRTRCPGLSNSEKRLHRRQARGTSCTQCTLNQISKMGVFCTALRSDVQRIESGACQQFVTNNNTLQHIFDVRKNKSSNTTPHNTQPLLQIQAITTTKGTVLHTNYNHITQLVIVYFSIASMCCSLDLLRSLFNSK